MLHEFVTLYRNEIIKRCRSKVAANRCLDEAIASAVTMYTRESERARFDQSEQRSNERVGFLVHELRNLVNTALAAFDVPKTGNVGVTGSRAFRYWGRWSGERLALPSAEPRDFERWPLVTI